jgi:large subunit ribosomal protein L14
MIKQQTVLKVADNSGAKKVKCIKLLGGFKRKTSFLGDVIIVSVKELRNKSKLTSKVSKGDVLKAIIVRTKTKDFKQDGVSLSFSENSVILINNQEKLIGTRILGPMPKILRRHKILKLVSVSTGFF